jgi:hypothetical protein
MKTSQAPVLESLRAVALFLDKHADKLGDVVTTGACQRLTDTIAAVDAHASAQAAGTYGSQMATQKKHGLRQALLRDHMAKIARIAKADLPNEPELQPLRMPRGRLSAARLAAAAAGMADFARPHANVFISAGMPSDFLDQLVAAADAMTNTIVERTNIRGRRGGATLGLKEQLSAGRRLVHVLDAFVQSQLKDDPSLLRNWNTAKRVRRVRRATESSAAPGSAPTMQA